MSKEFYRLNRIKESDQVTHTITWLKLNKNLMSSRRIALHRFWPAPSHQLGTGTLWRYWSTTRGSRTRENEERTSQHDLQKYQISSNGNSNIKYARETWQWLDVSVGWTGGSRTIHKKLKTLTGWGRCPFQESGKKSLQWPKLWRRHQTNRRF